MARSPGRGFLLLLPLVLLLIISLAAALGLAPLAQEWSWLAWVVFFATLAATVWVLYRERPPRPSRRA
jgi:FtsH-binding integral membrane protein